MFYVADIYVKTWKCNCVRVDPVSILRKSISGRHRPVRVPDGPMTARCDLRRMLAGDRVDNTIRRYSPGAYSIGNYHCSVLTVLKRNNVNKYLLTSKTNSIMLDFSK